MHIKNLSSKYFLLIVCCDDEKLMELENFYNNLRKDLGFKTIKFFKKEKKIGFFVILGQVYKKKYVLKISVNNKTKYKLMKNELKLDALLKYEFPNNEFIFAKIINHGEKDGFIWILREFFVGKSLATYTPGVFLDGNDIIQYPWFLNKKLVLADIVCQHSLLDKISKSDYLLYIGNDAVDSKNDIISYPLGEIERKFKISLKKVMECYNEEGKGYSQRESFQVGDLMLGNILLLKKNKVMLFDLERSSFDNKMFDYSRLWLYLWRYPVWQSELIKKVVVNNDNKIDLRLGVIRLILNHFNYSITRNQLIKKEDYVWAKILDAAGESYEALMKVKK